MFAGTLSLQGSADLVIHMLPEVVDQKWAGLTIDSDKEISIANLVVNNTLNGIKLRGNFASLNNVTSQFSSGNGIEITGHGNEIHAVEIEASFNTGNGIVFRSVDDSEADDSIRVERCHIRNNGASGIEVVAKAAVTISGCYVSDNILSGMRVNQNEGGSVLMEHSTLAGNGDSALEVTEGHTVILDHCTVRDHNYGNYFSTDSWETKPLMTVNRERGIELFFFRMSNSILTDNIADGIHVITDNNYQRDRIQLEFVNNNFMHGNRTLFVEEIYRFSYVADALSVLMMNNTFANNHQMTDSLVEIEVRSSANISIWDNIFERNNVDQLLTISGVTRSSSTGGIDVTGNRLIANSASTGLIVMNNYHNMSVSMNIFEDNSAPCYIQAPPFDVTYTIDARLNYLGSSSMADIVPRVCGFETNMEHSLVYYIPYYIDVDLDTLVQASQEDVDVEGFIGGEMMSGGEFSTAEFQSPITITRSIIIRLVPLGIDKKISQNNW